MASSGAADLQILVNATIRGFADYRNLSLANWCFRLPAGIAERPNLLRSALADQNAPDIDVICLDVTLTASNVWHTPLVKVGVISMQSERHVRLFRNGRNQALRIPREFELEGDEAIIRREGDRLIVEPVRKGRLLALLATLESIDETFPDVDDSLPPLDDVKL